MRPCRFFILVQDFSGGGGRQVPRGSLLSHAGELPSPDCAFWAKLLDTEAMVQVPARAVRELSKEQARMLQALTNGDERLELFRQEGLLGRRGALRPGDRVRVQITSASGEKVRGVLRYRGPMGDSKEQAGVIFGVELVVSEGGGFTDGAFRGQKFFSCRENCGVFVPVSRIEPDEGSECSPLMAPRGDPLKSPPLELGDRVFFRMGDSAPKGTVVFCDYLPKKEMTGVFVGIFLDQPVGSWDGKFKDQSLCHLPSPEYGILLPIMATPVAVTFCQPKWPPLVAAMPVGQDGHGSASPKALSDDSSLGVLNDLPSPSSIRYPPRPQWESPHGSPSSLLMGGTEERGEGEEEEGEEEELASPLLEINSMVEVHDPPIYGVIRWTGKLPDVRETIAGLELEPLPSGCTDGIYRGMRYFQCPPGKALFIKLRHCRPDARFGAPQPPENPVLRCNSLAFRVYASERVPEDTPPGLGEEGGQRLIGWKKGIQGHCNSCYLDATLFCMFAFSSVLDSLLLRPADKNDGASYEETRDLLRTEIIVNPLRKHGYVCATKVMSLRRVLEAAGHSPGFTSEEKDPEEFLTLLFRVLKVEPLFKIRSADKDPQGCIFYQIFMEGSAGGARRGVPTVQQLLEGSLAAGDLKFTEEKQCGGGWPWGAGAVTDTPPTALAAPRECCICQALALSECPQCFGDPSIGAGSTRQYCALCCQQVPPAELEHLPPPPGPLPRQTMQLYATLCIQTSHYVAFARHGPHRGQWLFFDSMADRQGELSRCWTPSACPPVPDACSAMPTCASTTAPPLGSTNSLSPGVEEYGD
uniref:ubiquitinyl hydrolase 1 n=1 Tax=Chelonoidis abingdonii TaxID=106734 RepID=A0A8C0IW99_CHEAB